MSKYTTGELAKLCDVTVRTVQYYDTRGILVPSSLSEGGRRLYSDQDLNKLRIICFLRELGVSIDNISRLFAEEKPERVVHLLIAQQEKLAEQELSCAKEKLVRLSSLKRAIKGTPDFSLNSIADIAVGMDNKKALRKVYITMFLTGLPITALQWVGILLWILKGVWWVFLVWLVLAILYGILASRYYLKKVAYICPECHTVFKPAMKEAIFANHTPSTRKLRCTNCGYHGFCVETIGKEDEK